MMTFLSKVDWLTVVFLAVVFGLLAGFWIGSALAAERKVAAKLQHLSTQHSPLSTFVSASSPDLGLQPGGHPASPVQAGEDSPDPGEGSPDVADTEVPHGCGAPKDGRFFTRGTGVSPVSETRDLSRWDDESPAKPTEE